MRPITRVALVGAGTIGTSWAAFYALHGLAVRVYDVEAGAAAASPEAARRQVEHLVRLGLAEASSLQALAITAVPSLAELVEGADLVHESVRETYEVKKPLFAELDALADRHCVLASSSSGLLMTEIQAGLAHPERALIAHPFNPPHLIPLVELVGGQQTSPAVLEDMRRFYLALGKEPVVLKREVPGHLANRMAAALWREAIDLVASGVASVEDVDTALRAGPGLRWAVMGPHLIYHLGGGQGGYRHFIEHIGTAFEAYWRTMPTWTAIPVAARQAIIEGVAAETHGRSTHEIAQERDVRLAAVLKALQAGPPARRASG